jgi:CubicO group peptidase (beta-lactamase class C family)
MQTFRMAVPTALAIALSSAAVAQQPADTTRVAVNRVFAAWSATDGPGCAVGVARDGQVVYENGYGMAIALLARDGKLSLDDDIRRYLPEIPDYGHRITIRHMLNHTSGWWRCRSP